jgi:hypothetical protein
VIPQPRQSQVQVIEGVVDFEASVEQKAGERYGS